jgi:O-antigen/teichoic acid export membrane protein
MRVDVLIIAFLLDDYAVGLYAPAEGIINALYIVPLAIHFVMVPVLSNLFQRDINQAWLTTRRFFYVLVLVGLGLFLVVFFGAEFIVLLLGPSYAGSLEILKILSIILFIHSISFGTAAILVATKQQSQRTIVQAVAVFINITLNIYVIGKWGITGIAFVYVLTEIVLLAGYSFLVARYRRKSLSGLSLTGKS